MEAMQSEMDVLKTDVAELKGMRTEIQELRGLIAGLQATVEANAEKLKLSRGKWTSGDLLYRQQGVSPLLLSTGDKWNKAKSKIPIIGRLAVSAREKRMRSRMQASVCVCARACGCACVHVNQRNNNLVIVPY